MKSSDRGVNEDDEGSESRRGRAPGRFIGLGAGRRVKEGVV